MEDPNFFLEGVLREKDELKDFEGPLSLILMLLQKNKIEIRDISVSDILDQYMQYLEQMQKMDLEVTSEFVRMASYLLYIKTKMLLTNDEEEISELQALIESLEQLKCKDAQTAVREVMPVLNQSYQKGVLIFSKPPEPLPKVAHEYQRTHEPVELLKALLNVFTVTEAAPPPDMSAIQSAIPRQMVYSIRTKGHQLIMRLREKGATLAELYGECKSRSELIATFMAILELCSIGAVKVNRNEQDRQYDVSYSGGDDIAGILERISD